MPDIYGRPDYSSFLYEAISGVGDALNKERDRQALQQERERNYARDLSLDAYKQGQDVLQNARADRLLTVQEQQERRIGSEPYEVGNTLLDRKTLKPIYTSPPTATILRDPTGYERTATGLRHIKGGPNDPVVIAEKANAARGGGGGITTKMRNDAVAVDQAFRSLDQSLNDYESLIKQTGLVALPGKDADAVGLARTNLMLQLKELHNLGVLQGQDFKLMSDMLFNPATDFGDPVGNIGKYASAMGIGDSLESRADASLKLLRKTIRGVRDAKTKGILDESGQFVGGAPAAPVPSGAGGAGAANAPVENLDGIMAEANRLISEGRDPAEVKQWLQEEYDIETEF